MFNTKMQQCSRKSIVTNGLLGTTLLAAIALATLTQSAANPSAAARIKLAAGHVRYVEPVTGTRAVATPRASTTQLRASATAALDAYARSFGLSDPASELELVRTMSLGAAGSSMRYRQLHNGIPVIGGELVMTLDGAGNLRSLSGEVWPKLALPSLRPRVSGAQARRTALLLASKHRSLPIGRLKADEPELSIYKASLIGPDNGRRPSLVWRVEVTALDPAPVRELVLVDATTGGVTLSFNQAETLRNRLTYSAGGGSATPGTLLCDESQPLCTNGVNVDADFAHRYAGDAYDFYFSNHGRDSYDNLGASIISTVEYAPANYCPNASWNGTQMLYCAGAPAADDVVGHEFTHAVTRSTSDLYYYYQSGAINESFSDVWGEFIDLTNTSGTDTAATRWYMGEDWAGLGVIRNMRNPPEFGDPDRMRSPIYFNSDLDNGGVHTNSGINNKATSLMVDGGQFNGYTISGIGISKVAALYYRVQTQHLTSGADYADLNLSLNQACQNMIGGSAGITVNDCLQVANALGAVEMHLEPLANTDTDVSACPVNQVSQDVYYDDFEGPPDPTRWVSSALVGAVNWFATTGYATSGSAMYLSTGSSSVSDTVLTMIGGVTIPADAWLHFRHSFDQEADTSGTSAAYYDGGVLEYSTDGGATWLDAAPLYDAGQNYNGVLFTGSDNPLAGRNAFGSASHGFVSTRYNLSSFAGRSMRIRFRNTSDMSVQSFPAWIVDQVRVYTCATDPSPNSAPVARAGNDLTVAPQTTVTLDGSQSADTDGFIVASQWTQLSGLEAKITETGRSSSFTAPVTPTQDTLTFRLTVTDNRGAVSTDDVAVTVVNQQPVSSAGADQSVKPRVNVGLLGSATDSDGTIASYAWTQVSGPAVTLSSTNSEATNFTTPSVVVSQTIVLQLTATDNFGGQGSDNVSVTITNDQPIANAGADATVNAGASVTLTASGSDPDGTVVSYSWAQTGGPAVTLGGATTTSARFAAPSQSAQSQLIFRITVTDNDGGTGSDTVTITVNARPKGGGGAIGFTILLPLLILLWRRKNLART